MSPDNHTLELQNTPFPAPDPEREKANRERLLDDTREIIAQQSAEIAALRARIAELEARAPVVTEAQADALLQKVCVCYRCGRGAVGNEERCDQMLKLAHAEFAALAVAGTGDGQNICGNEILGIAGAPRPRGVSKNVLAPSSQHFECDRCTRLWTYLTEARRYADEHGFAEMRDAIDVLRNREC